MENKLLAQLVGPIENPLGSTGYGGFETGVTGLLSNILRLFFVAAGIMALMNFLTAGFNFINAGGDSKKVEHAWTKIWQSLLGLVLVVGSFAFAALFGQLVFGNPLFMLSPTIYGPQ